MENEKEWITANVASLLLHVSKVTLHNYVKDGTIKPDWIKRIPKGKAVRVFYDKLKINELACELAGNFL